MSWSSWRSVSSIFSSLCVLYTMGVCVSPHRRRCCAAMPSVLRACVTPAPPPACNGV